jgi:hypothetical protein
VELGRIMTEDMPHSPNHPHKRLYQLAKDKV